MHITDEEFEPYCLNCGIILLLLSLQKRARKDGNTQWDTKMTNEILKAIYEVGWSAMKTLICIA